MIEIILTALVSNGLVLIALGFLSKSIIKHFLDKDISAFKADIQSKATQEIESYKSNLEKEKIRLQISYGGIFEKQAEAIIKIYHGLLMLDRATETAVHAPGDGRSRKNQFQEPWANLRRDYLESKILLPEDIDTDLSNFINEIFHNVFKYTTMDDRMFRAASDDEFAKFSKNQDEALAVIEKELPALKEKLIKKMRERLGIMQ